MKRNDCFSPIHEAKKPKLQLNTNNTEDIWGDDPEIEELDKCLNLATQISQDQRHNDLINKTVSYEEFKARNVCSSTQMFSKRIQMPSHTSKIQLNLQMSNIEASIIRTDIDKEELVREITELKEQNKTLQETKRTSTGEITILRAQLAQAQKQIEQERLDKIRSIEATNQKWNLKLINAVKDSVSCKNNSELKELEIANLKEKLSELKRSHNITLNTTQEFLNTDSKRSRVNGNNSKDSAKYVQTENNIPFTSYDSICPLEELIPESYFDQCSDNSLTSKQFRRLRSGVQCENCLHSEVITLRRCTEEQVNSPNLSPCINKILFVVRESLLSLLSKLQTNTDLSPEYSIINYNLLIEDEKINSHNYCLFSKQRWHDCEVGADLRRSLAVCSHLLLYSKVIYEYFTGSLKSSLDYNFIQQSNQSATELISSDTYNFDFLNILLNIFKVIEKNDRAIELAGFEAAVVKLLSNLAKKENISEECCVIINVIFKTLISLKFHPSLVRYTSEFLKCMSSHLKFVLLLCKMSNMNFNQKLFKENIKTTDICTLEKLIKKLNISHRDIQINCDIIEFLLNTLAYNAFWENNAESERCSCLAEIYNIVCDILYNCLESYSHGVYINTENPLGQYYKKIFRMGILFLDILVVRHPELIGRYSRLYYQYQAILKKIDNIRESLELEIIQQTTLDQLLSQLYIDVQNIENTSDTTADAIFEQSFLNF